MAKPSRPTRDIRVIDATVNQIIARSAATGLAQAVATMARITLTPLNFVDVKRGDIAAALQRGEADVALLAMDEARELARSGAVADLSQYGATFVRDGIHPVTAGDRIIGAELRARPPAAIVVANTALKKIANAEKAGALAFDLVNTLIIWWQCLNLCLVSEIVGPTSPPARCRDNDREYTVNWATINAAVIDVTWTKVAPPGAAVGFRTASTKNPGPIFPLKDDGGAAYSHRSEDEVNMSTFEVPL